MANKDVVFEVTKTLNNIKNHDYSVADYKMCKDEAEIVVEALELFIYFLQYSQGADGKDIRT